MSSLLLILLSSVLVTTAVLAHVPRWRPFVGVDDLFDGAAAVALAALFIVPVVASTSWLLAALVLKPGGLEYLRTPAFVAVTLIVVPLVEVMLRRRGKPAPQRPGFALLLTTNAAPLGVALIVQTRAGGFGSAVLLAVAAGAALGLLLIAFAALYERIRHADVPIAFREAPLALLTAGIIALAFMGFSGLVQE